MQEDYPMFIKMIGKGYKMCYMDKVTVYKRIVPTSIQYEKQPNDINVLLFISKLFCSSNSIIFFAEIDFFIDLLLYPIVGK